MVHRFRISAAPGSTGFCALPFLTGRAPAFSPARTTTRTDLFSRCAVPAPAGSCTLHHCTACRFVLATVATTSPPSVHHTRTFSLRFWFELRLPTRRFSLPAAALPAALPFACVTAAFGFYSPLRTSIPPAAQFRSSTVPGSAGFGSPARLPPHVPVPHHLTLVYCVTLPTITATNAGWFTPHRLQRHHCVPPRLDACAPTRFYHRLAGLVLHLRFASPLGSCRTWFVLPALSPPRRCNA